MVSYIFISPVFGGRWKLKIDYYKGAGFEVERETITEIFEELDRLRSVGAFTRGYVEKTKSEFTTKDEENENGKV